MRISFDIDDTLIFCDKSRNGNSKLLNGESLREGTIELLRQLQVDHELFIYTTSLRRPWLLKLSFRLKGVRIRRVINQDEHQKLSRELGLSAMPTKYPSKFGIDLHIDDSEGVQIEGKQHGFNVLRISQDDDHWTRTVRNGIDEVLQSGPKHPSSREDGSDRD